MILVIAGTKDGREIAERLAARGYGVVASVVSGYGSSLFKSSSIRVNCRPLPKEELTAFIKENGITTLIDATHPYAAQISQTAIDIAAQEGLHYLRYERAASPLPDYDRLYVVADYEAAAVRAGALGRRIFLTTGSRKLSLFARHEALQNAELTARVLPEADVIAECNRLGFTPRNLVAMQGPFSHALNVELYQKYRAEVVVTKNSGDVGGTDTKITAAMELHLALVLIDRPRIVYPNVADAYETVESFVARFETIS